MKAFSLLETRRKNKYFFDQKKKRFQLCHPLLHHLIHLHEQMDVPAVKERIDTAVKEAGYLEIDGYGRFTKNDTDYYYAKFLLLKENGYFTDIDTQARLGAGLNADMVKRNLANVRQVVFEVTNECNLACAYCIYGQFYDSHDDEEENKNTGGLDVRKAKKLIDYLMELWESPLNQSRGKTVYIGFYGGEPLLDIRFLEEIVGYVNQFQHTRSRYAFSLTTNGTFLRKHMDFLNENKFLLLVSLDGDERHNSYRVFKNKRPVYDTVLENLHALRDIYPDYFSTHVRFNAVLHNRNSVSDIYHYFKKNLNATPSINALNTGGIKPAKKKEFWETYSNVEQSLRDSEDYSMLQKEMFDKLPNVDDAVRLVNYCNDFCFRNYKGLILEDKEGTRPPTGTCSPFLLKIFLTADGGILPCERIGHQFRLGQVTPDSVELDFEAIAETYNNYFRAMRKQCVDCYNSETCAQCMFHLNDIDGENPECRGFMTKGDHARYLSSFVGGIEEDPDMFRRIMRRDYVD